MTAPAYNAYANPRPTFQPAMRLITAITQTNPAVVTTSFAHQYRTGTIVRLYIPAACGMPEANQQTGIVTVLSPTTFSLTIDASTYEPFAVPVIANPHIDTAAQVVPIGEDNATILAATQNVLPYSAT